MPRSIPIISLPDAPHAAVRLHTCVNGMQISGKGFNLQALTCNTKSPQTVYLNARSPTRPDVDAAAEHTAATTCHYKQTIQAMIVHLHNCL